MANANQLEQRWPSWLRIWAWITFGLLVLLLLLGAVVTSFKVGMADPIWPTKPWHLFTISWQEPSAGFLIEHVHRLAGFSVGGAVAILALGLWWTDPRPVVRWGMPAALLALLVAFGQLHGSMLKYQRLMTHDGEMVAPDWATVLGPTAIALAITLPLALRAVFRPVPGSLVRFLGLLLLLTVMLQGLLGGARVYLNARLGADLAATHGVFAQIVLGLAIAVVLLLGQPLIPARSWAAPRPAATAALLAAALVFVQIIAGAMVRHSTWWFAPRLHLATAFLVVIAILATSRSVPAEAPRSIRFWNRSTLAFVVLQVIVGVEAWIMRFQHGFLEPMLSDISVWDASVRTFHSVAGYGLFASAVALALLLAWHRAGEAAPTHVVFAERKLETVV